MRSRIADPLERTPDSSALCDWVESRNWSGTVGAPGDPPAKMRGNLGRIGTQSVDSFIMSPTVDEIREKVAALMRRRGVVRASLFGSVARGESTERSDVDFLVEFEKGRSLVDLSGLRLDLCEVLGREVDVATPNSLHPRLREQVLGELVPLL